MTEPLLTCTCCNGRMAEDEAAPAPANIPAQFRYHRDIADCWRHIGGRPATALRSYINSEQEQDREYAQAECEKHGLNYAAARQIIILEMVRAQEANEPARANRRAAKGKTP